MIIHGECLSEMEKLPGGSVDMVYLDPPFFTQKVHKLSSRQNEAYKFSDVWSDLSQYKQFIGERLSQSKRLLRDTGTVFLHCDRAASHHLRALLDDVFGCEHFLSEIIWSYRRWSNAKNGLLNAHQNIYFYSKTSRYKFNAIYGDYSPTTNVDQILQKRERNKDGKAVYKRNQSGEIEIGGFKKGVPLTDVWDMPFLNPKATERSGYPTQKPLHLIERLILLSTDECDVVLDPFCGSGTTLVAAKLLNRKYIGIDSSEKALELTRRRLAAPLRSESRLLKDGEASYKNQSPEVEKLLTFIDAVVVQRNSGIDGFLKQEFGGKPVPVRVQRDWESLHDAQAAFRKACREKGCLRRILIVTNPHTDLLLHDVGIEEPELILVDALHLSIHRAMQRPSNSNPPSVDSKVKKHAVGSD
jgi:site-specific DNA-methyltransferase (adenine-specific)